MKAIEGNFFTVLNGDRQYVIPVYQRYYSWGEEQCDRLWRDIVAMQKNKTSNHFIGSFVSITESDMPIGTQKFMVIDGQQRLTTLSILMIVLRDCLRAIPEGERGDLDPRAINARLLINEYDNDNKYKLRLNDVDAEDYASLIEGRDRGPEEVPSRIIQNYNFFRKKVTGCEISYSDVYTAINKLLIVSITLDRSSDNAQAIFESLNSTGKELSESDLIRNYVLMGLTIKEQYEVYGNIWRPMERLFGHGDQEILMDKFFRDYLTLKTGHIPKINRVYDEFKIFRSSKREINTSDFCEDIKKYAKYYTDMVFCRNKNTNIRKQYIDISELHMEVVYPFLLGVHGDFSDGKINESELEEILGMCINYVFRRAICSIPTNSLNKTFANFYAKIDKNDYVKSICAEFILSDSYRRFPSDEEFATAFETRDIYNMRLRNYILTRLENSYNKAPINAANYTIEHIMPQNKNLSKDWRIMLGGNWEAVHDKYLHTIGNLTLTGYNPELSDRPFLEKREMERGFKQAGLLINSEIINRDEWNEASIISRARKLSERAIKIWNRPLMSEEELQRYVPKDDAPVYTIESYDFGQHTRELFDALDRRIMNISPDIVRTFSKLYIAYRLETIFADIVVQKQALKITVKANIEDINNPAEICRDVRGVGRWGNGNVEINFYQMSDLDNVVNIIQQAYEAQL